MLGRPEPEATAIVRGFGLPLVLFHVATQGVATASQGPQAVTEVCPLMAGSWWSRAAASRTQNLKEVGPGDGQLRRNLSGRFGSRALNAH